MNFKSYCFYSCEKKKKSLDDLRTELTLIRERIDDIYSWDLSNEVTLHVVKELREKVKEIKNEMHDRINEM